MTWQPANAGRCDLPAQCLCGTQRNCHLKMDRRQGLNCQRVEQSRGTPINTEPGSCHRRANDSLPRPRAFIYAGCSPRWQDAGDFGLPARCGRLRNTHRTGPGTLATLAPYGGAFCLPTRPLGSTSPRGEHSLRGENMALSGNRDIGAAR